MSLAEDRALLAAKRWRGGRLVIAALAGTLPAAYVIAGFAIVGAAAMLAVRAGKEDDRLAAPIAIFERGDDFLRAIVAGLPDPVVALDRDSRVLALNERARAMARSGE